MRDLLGGGHGCFPRGSGCPGDIGYQPHCRCRKTEFPGDKYVSSLMAIDIEANALIARHTHPGVESSYLATGILVLSVQGQPDRVMKAGDGAQVPPEVPHSVRNGPEKSRVVAMYMVEKDKPLLSVAPE